MIKSHVLARSGLYGVLPGAPSAATRLWFESITRKKKLVQDGLSKAPLRSERPLPREERWLRDALFVRLDKMRTDVPVSADTGLHGVFGPKQLKRLKPESNKNVDLC